VYRVREKETLEGGSRDLYRLLIEPAVPHIHGKDFLITLTMCFTICRIRRFYHLKAII
jgi:hypothetical protein